MRPMAARRVHEARTMTLREWANLPDDVEGELVDGRLVEEEMPDRHHERAVLWLGTRLLTFLEDRGGEVVGSEIKYGVAPRRGRKPDLSVFFPGGPHVEGNARVTMVPPDLMVEVITSTPRDTARDRIDKAREYALFGVRWYWLVDAAAQTIEILELGSKHRYTRFTAANAGKLKVPGCRGLELDLDALWRYVKR